MKFKDLTKENIEYIKSVYLNKDINYTKRISILSELFDLSERQTRKWLVNLGIKDRHAEEPQDYIKAKKKKFNKKTKKFIITWAQNSTPVHQQFFNNVKAYADIINADIHVIAGRYQNPTSVFADKKHDTWASEVLPYLDANRHSVHKHMTIMSDYKISPTATNPMLGLRGDTGDNSCVFGHPRVHMETVPVLDGHAPKVMFTTGACTVENYTDSKSGKKGEFHHTLGFVIIEIKDDDVFYCRQVTASDDGSFYDIYYYVSNGEITKNKRLEAIVLGDIHLGHTDENVMNKTIELLNELQPKNTIIHDLFDGYSINHHEINNPIAQFKKEQNGTNSLKKEIDYMIQWLETMRKYNLVVVRSNHDDFVDRWIINSDWKKNVKNAMEYMEYTRVLLNGEAKKGIIPYIVNKTFEDIITLDRDESFMVKGWELGYHGDMGTGGSRGSLQQFRNLSTKTITGHSHTPGRLDGSLAVGTSTRLRVGYNKGASNWLHSHVIIHKDGKAQHINFITSPDGTTGFTTFK